MLYSEEASWNKLTKAEQEEGVAAYRGYTEALTKAGVLKGSNRCSEFGWTTVRVANGKPQVLDGPYVESKEQIVATILSTWSIWMRRSLASRCRAQVTVSSKCVHPGACRREPRRRVNA